MKKYYYKFIISKGGVNVFHSRTDNCNEHTAINVFHALCASFEPTEGYEVGVQCWGETLLWERVVEAEKRFG